MKTISYKYLLLLLILPAITLANEVKGKYKREKTIHKSYAVNSNALLDINNKYGNIFVTTWDQNTTEIDVIITVVGNNEKDVIQRFNGIDVAFSATKAAVNATTKISGSSYNNSSLSMQINYTIKIPKNGGISLDNQYGGIRTGMIFGKANINCQYGDMVIEGLNNDNNTLKLQYCGSVKANYIKSAVVNVQYSQFTVVKGNTLVIKGEYSGITINDIGDITYTSDYGDVTIRNANNVTGKTEYTSSKFETISGQLNLTASYGDIRVDSFYKTTRNIAVNAEYTGITLGLNESYPFDFEIHTEYTDIKGNAGFKYTLKQEKDNEGHYKGYYKNNGVNRIYIDAEYGHLHLIRK